MDGKCGPEQYNFVEIDVFSLRIVTLAIGILMKLIVFGLRIVALANRILMKFVFFLCDDVGGLEHSNFDAICCFRAGNRCSGH